MKIEYKPIVDFYDLRDALKLQYDVNIDIDMLFPEYKNDSYESFCFRDLAAEYEDQNEVDGAHLAAYYLADILPMDYDYCLIRICW